MITGACTAGVHDACPAPRTCTCPCGHLAASKAAARADAAALAGYHVIVGPTLPPKAEPRRDQLPRTRPRARTVVIHPPTSEETTVAQLLRCPYATCSFTTEHPRGLKRHQTVAHGGPLPTAPTAPPDAPPPDEETTGALLVRLRDRLATELPGADVRITVTLTP